MITDKLMNAGTVSDFCDKSVIFVDAVATH